MNESIFRFLLEAGFPRASVVTELPPVRVVVSGNNGANNTAEYRPDYLIVDPDSSEGLAVIDVVESGSPDAVVATGTKVKQYARQLPDPCVQSYVMQLDVNNPVKDRQVRFFRIAVEDGAQKKIEAITSYAFPDLAAMKVARRLAMRNDSVAKTAVASQEQAVSAPAPVDNHKADARAQRSTLVDWLAIALLLLGVVDWLVVASGWPGLFSLHQTLFVIAAAILFALPRLLHLTRQ